MALSIGHGQVEGNGVDRSTRQLRAEQDEADLRSVSMGDHHSPARFQQVGRAGYGSGMD